MQRAALPRQPSINLSYVSLDPIIAEVALSPNLVVAEVNVRIAFYWLKDLRSYPEFHGLEEQLGDSVPASSLSTADPATLKGGAFVLYCRLCPLPLLSKRLQDDAWLAQLDALLQSARSRKLTCEALLSLAHLKGCDCSKALENMVSILSDLPDGNPAAGTIA